MNVIPAIDLRGGCIVRLRQGDFAHTRRFALDPLDVARGYRAAGAERLHVVDLDGARDARPTQLHAIAAMAATGLAVQAGGGVRRRDDLAVLFDVGVARVVIGSVAVRDTELAADWLREYGPQRIVLALDLRCGANGAWRPAVDAWRQDIEASPEGILDRLAEAGLRHVLCTDIARDGMAAGPNCALYTELVRRWPQIEWIASGGVRDERDLAALRRSGVAACVAGTALLDGTLPASALARPGRRPVPSARSLA
jgi:phosphoribosylformimino-5-aminoimidazole carboxamide ribotide isomerase